MEIRSSREAAHAVANALRESGMEYCQFNLGSISNALPVPGSIYRDGVLSETVNQALNVWGQFLINRGMAIEHMSQTMTDTDSSIASNLR